MIKFVLSKYTLQYLLKNLMFNILHLGGFLIQCLSQDCFNVG